MNERDISPQAAPAGRQSAKVDFHISPQSLNDALIELGKQAGMSVLVHPSVNPIDTEGLSGEYDVWDGLDVLLADTGLAYRIQGSGVVVYSPETELDVATQLPDQNQRAATSAPARWIANLGAALIGVFGGSAMAQDGSGGSAARASVIEEIVVTAQRKEESVQDVAIAVTAMSGQQLEEFNIQDATRVTDQVPNFYAGGLGGPGAPPFFAIRGVVFVDFSNVNESSTGLYVDEVYLASQGMGAMQLFDLERVEVLRGPQGTLFGRNTTAGVVQYISKKPTDEFEGNVSLQYGDNNQVIAQLAAGGPLTEGVRGRLAFKYNRDDGFQKNYSPGSGSVINDVSTWESNGRLGKTDAWAGRGIMQFDLSDRWMLEVNGHYSTNDGETVQPLAQFGLNPNDLTQWCGGFPASGTLEDQAHGACLRATAGANDVGAQLIGQHSDEAYSERDDWPIEYDAWGGYLKFVGDMEFANFTSITAYEDYDQLYEYDFDGWNYRDTDPTANVDFNTHWESDAKQFSQEIRLDGVYESLNWTAGAYYYAAEQSVFSGTRINGNIGSEVDARTETDSWAIFAQIGAPIAETLTLVSGLRYTSETRKLARMRCLSGGVDTGACSPDQGKDKIDTTATTGKLALEWRPMDDSLYYASFSHGFKSGGFNPNAVVQRRGPVDQETVDSFEIGMKQTFADNTLRLNGAIFYNEFKDIQALVGSVDPNTGASVVFYINAGDPDIYGAELELAWAPTESLEILLGAAYLDTEISAAPNITADGRPLDGKELPQAPEFALNGMVRYHFDLGDSGRLTLQADGRWQDEFFTGVDNDPVEAFHDYGVLNLRARWASAGERYNAEVFVDNVTDELIIQHVFHNTESGHGTPDRDANLAFVQDGFRTAGRPRLWGVRVGMNF